MSSRRGFTLVELLVVIALMLVLVGMTVLMVPRIQENQRVAQGASMVQHTLMIAKQRALRDRVPVGVRLSAGAKNLLWVTELQYIAQPEDYTGGTISTPGPNSLTVDFSVTLGSGADKSLWEVQQGDYIELRGGGLVRRIANVDPKQVRLEPNSPGMPTLYQIGPTTNYRIIRQARVLGDEPVQLPDSVAIDLTLDPKKNPAYHPVLPATGPQYFDILFAPSGAVIGPAAAYDKIILWVRDTSLPNATDGEVTLICIYTRSGAIAAHPLDVRGPNFYSFTEDGRSSGQ